MDECTPKYSSSSLGYAENANRMIEGEIRTVRSALEGAIGKALCIEMPILAWLVRHAAWLITRFQVRTDGSTGYRNLKGKKYSGDVAEFGEQVFLKDAGLKQAKLEDRWLGPYTWVGKSDKTDEHIAVSEDGRSVKTGRPIRRQPEGKRWDVDKTLQMQVTPWEPHVDTVKVREPIFKRRYTTLNEIIKHGASPDCRSCRGDGGAHSGSCRARFDKIWDKEEAADRRKAEAAVGPKVKPAAAAASSSHETQAAGHRLGWGPGGNSKWQGRRRRWRNGARQGDGQIQ
jgi:hypothetical protein